MTHTLSTDQSAIVTDIKLKVTHVQVTFIACFIFTSQKR